MIRQRKTSDCVRISRIRLWQDLSVLVAEVQKGSIVKQGDPEYVLLSKATQTIQRFLESTSSDENTGNPVNAAEHLEPHGASGWPSPDPWILEMGFWDNLAEHPFLSSIDPVFQDWQ